MFFQLVCCPRQNYEQDWRKEAISLLNKYNFKGDIINPTNPNFQNIDLKKQIQWEHQGLCMASVILFWIPRTKEHPAFTTNIEFGQWMNHSNVIVGFPENSEKNDYIKMRVEMNGSYVSNTLQECVLRAIKALNRNTHTFFTSDTHFSAERTLTLSKRPYKDIEEMDLQLISNWNKKITMNDVVFHLGDFGNPEKIKLLNFKKMYFLPGNYEEKDNSIVDELKKDNRIEIIKKNMKVKINGKSYCLTHKVLNDNLDENNFYLFGHIHRLQLVKRNGINVGIDCNRYSPFSVKEIEFLRNGIENYFDENVFIDKCKDLK